MLSSKLQRLETYYKITDRDANLVTFKLNEAQKHFLANRAKRNIILKSRRLGFTTFAALDMLDSTLFTPNYESLIISYDDNSAQNIFDTKVILAWKHYPYQQLYHVDTDRASKLKFDFGDKTYSSIAVKSSGRGDSTMKLHISEFGKICYKYPAKAYEILTGTIPSVPLEKGEITIESTAEGSEGHFFDMFWRAWNRPQNQPLKPTEYKAFFYNWQWDHSEINKVKQLDAQLPQEFKEFQNKHNTELVAKHPDLYTYIDDIQITYYFYKWLECNQNWDILRQEFPTYPTDAFKYSGNLLFDQNILQKYIDKAEDPLRVVNEWHIYHEPIPSHTYAMGADPSEGVGQDHSAAAIFDFTPTLPRPILVATYKNNKISPDELAYELRFGGQLYYNALIAVERNNSGHATLTTLKGIYPEDKIYKTVNEDKFDDEETERLGWHTNQATKPKMFYEFKSALNDKLLDIPSKELLHEAMIYDRKYLSTTKFDPEATNHFDLLTATAIAYQMRTAIEDDSQEIITYSPHKQSRTNIHEGI